MVHMIRLNAMGTSAPPELSEPFAQWYLSVFSVIDKKNRAYPMMDLAKNFERCHTGVFMNCWKNSKNFVSHLSIIGVTDAVP
ncbi:Hypothetical predicted protein [Octopus vulgaris]|uniref:Uncharacterized protein n=1 Tax=Octopus vulgaris TaxID=6645 RepID=A0AA36FA72_OCTVU|nr:Hypothetical predicted protein [Octopus vulgaris]